MDHVQGPGDTAVSGDQQCSEDDFSTDLVPNSYWEELFGDQDKLVIAPGVAIHNLADPGVLLQGDRLDVPGPDGDLHLQPVQLGVSAAHPDPADQPGDHVLTRGHGVDHHRPVAALTPLYPDPDHIISPLASAFVLTGCCDADIVQR